MIFTHVKKWKCEISLDIFLKTEVLEFFKLYFLFLIHVIIRGDRFVAIL